jgi:hypothetical protein
MKSSRTRGLRLVSRTASSLAVPPETTRPISTPPVQIENIITEKYLQYYQRQILLTRAIQNQEEMETGNYHVNNDITGVPHQGLQTKRDKFSGFSGRRCHLRR